MTTENFDESASLLGLRMMLALFDSTHWSHRHVESLSLLEGERERRRVSIDCTPEKILWAVASQVGEISHLEIVPLAMMAKAPLRDVDTLDGEMRPFPILGSQANGLIAAAVLGATVQTFSGQPVTQQLWAELQSIAMGPASIAVPLAESLLSRLKLPVVPKNLVLDIAKNFILIAVLPSGSSGTRQILKYSYHWQPRSTVRPRGKEIFRPLVAGFGVDTLGVVVEVNSYSWSRSFHFECVAPAGLVVHSIVLPADSSGGLVVDASRSPVGHANGHYSQAAQGLAEPVRVFFEVESPGMVDRLSRWAIGVALGFVAIMFVPNLLETLINHVDAATALLLGFPAILLSLNARARENRMVSTLLRPVRLSFGVLGGLIFALLALLLVEPTTEWIFLFSAVGATSSIGLVMLTIFGMAEMRVGKRV